MGPGKQPRAEDLVYISGPVPQKRFRHLTAAGIVFTIKKNPFLPVHIKPRILVNIRYITEYQGRRFPSGYGTEGGRVFRRRYPSFCGSGSPFPTHRLSRNRPESVCGTQTDANQHQHDRHLDQDADDRGECGSGRKTEKHGHFEIVGRADQSARKNLVLLLIDTPR